MLRHSPSRNQRSKGIKRKHVLQICMLLAVCFWLIYQVKHSHDKRKELDEKENGAKVLVKEQSVDEILKLGRKDLHPRVEEKASDTEKQEEEEVEEEETGGGEENRKQEAEELGEEEENKIEEKEDEERGGGDDEIDELDQDRTEGDDNREEDLTDEEKEREEEIEEKEGQTENENLLEDQDHEGSGRNTHEAREEHYKADDASSAVAHDTDAITTEMEKINSENRNENAGLHILEQEDKSNNTEEINDHNISDVKVEEGQTAENITLNEIAGQENGNGTILSKSEYSSESNDQPQLKMNTSSEDPVSALLNGTETILNSSQPQNATLEGLAEKILLEQANNSSVADDSNQPNSSLTILTKIEDADTSAGGFKNFSRGTDHTFSENTTSFNGTSEANDHFESLTIMENPDTIQNDKLDSEKETGKTDESEDSLTNDNSDDVQHDTGNSSDSILEEEKENRIDLDTLPGIRTEGVDNEDAAAE